MADTYRDFAHLAAHEREGDDFAITVRVRDPQRVVIAPHGGGIERGSSELANAIAGAQASLYAFEGLKRKGNSSLHVTSTRFDEPRLLAMLAPAGHVLAVHGEGSERRAVYVGGGDEAAAARMRAALAAAGFTAEAHAVLAGRDPANVCNRGRAGAGLQLEVSLGLRREMFDDVTLTGVRRTTARFTAFVAAVRDAWFAGS
jgi:phage replication-related protein YjqB (UPF0714/DUF867 family)